MTYYKENRSSLAAPQQVREAAHAEHYDKSRLHGVDHEGKEYGLRFRHAIEHEHRFYRKVPRACAVGTSTANEPTQNIRNAATGEMPAVKSKQKKAM